MKPKTKRRPLLQHGDSWKMLITVIWAEAFDLSIVRIQDFGYQIEGWNFWPNAGTIARDSEAAHELHGLTGLCRLLDVPIATVQETSRASFQPAGAAATFQETSLPDSRAATQCDAVKSPPQDFNNWPHLQQHARNKASARRLMDAIQQAADPTPAPRTIGGGDESPRRKFNDA